MKYFRVHTSDIAYLTQQPRGIFTTVGKLVEAKTLTEEETAEYWKQREYFEKISSGSSILQRWKSGSRNYLVQRYRAG